MNWSFNANNSNLLSPTGYQIYCPLCHLPLHHCQSTHVHTLDRTERSQNLVCCLKQVIVRKRVHWFENFIQIFPHSYKWCHSVWGLSMRSRKKTPQVSLTSVLWFRIGEHIVLGQEEDNMDALHLHWWVVKGWKMRLWCQSEGDRLLVHLCRDTALTARLFLCVLSCRSIQRLHSLAELSPRWVKPSLPRVGLRVHCSQQVGVRRAFQSLIGANAS